MTLLMSACCDDEPGLSVRGSFAVVGDQIDTGFTFAEETLLADESEVADGGPVAGRCAVSASGVVEVAIARPAEPDPASCEIRSFEILVPAMGEQALARVSVELGGRAYEGFSDETCSVEVIYVNTETGQAGVAVACTVAAEDGTEAEAEAEAELHFRGCEIVEAE